MDLPIKEITKKEILTREFNRYFEQKTMKEFILAYQLKLDSSEMSAKKVSRRDSDGKPISYEDISRKEYIEILEKELADIEVLLETLRELK